MVQTYSAPRESFYDGDSQSLGIDHYLGIVKRRAIYFILTFVAVLLIGAFITAIQRPIYEAKGKVLVETAAIPTDLVRPTVTDTANERIQVIQQRIMTRDNLLQLVNKYGMFKREQQWMSDTQLLELMKDRTKFELVDINPAFARPSAATIAFSVSFDYENPSVALSVANDVLTLILNEDARNRTNRATETTSFLSQELQRLQAELSAIEARITQEKLSPQTDLASALDPARMQLEELTKLKEDLAQKSSVYSSEYPGIKALRKKIAAMQDLIAHTPPPPAATAANSGLVQLEQQAAATEKELEDTNKKLEEAHLGERLERDQESERLEVIEQPVLPQVPIKPNKVKLMALAFALAVAAGAGVAFAAESLDRSIRHRNELLSVANGRLIVSIPYISTRAEEFRKKSRFALVGVGVAVLLLAGVVAAVIYLPPIDLTWVKQFGLDHLTALSK